MVVRLNLLVLGDRTSADAYGHAVCFDVTLCTRRHEDFRALDVKRIVSNKDADW